MVGHSAQHDMIHSLYWAVGLDLSHGLTIHVLLGFCTAKGGL
jgi:hypothetical protein